MRRTQQELLYAAERPVERGRSFATHAELERFVHEVVASPWWEREHPRVRVVEVPEVRRRPGEGSVGAWDATDDSGVIEMWEGHWNARCVLHELAHVAAAPRGSTSHDPIFARVYLDLVREFLSFPAYAELQRSFTEAGIEVQPSNNPREL